MTSTDWSHLSRRDLESKLSLYEFIFFAIRGGYSFRGVKDPQEIAHYAISEQWPGIRQVANHVQWTEGITQSPEFRRHARARADCPECEGWGVIAGSHGNMPCGRCGTTEQGINWARLDVEIDRYHARRFR